MCAREAAGEPSCRLAQTDPLSAETLAGLLRREVASCSGPRFALVVHELEPGTAQHRIVAAQRWRGGIDSPALGRALNVLVARRIAALPSLDGESGQHVADAPEEWLREHDAGSCCGGQVAEWLESAAHEPLDLIAGEIARIQVYRRTAGEVIVLIVVHHRIADFWSMTSLIRELEKLYHELRGGIPAPLPGLADLVRHYVWVAGTRASTYATAHDTES
jgi:nonribosomal peptide synthetase protein BlmVI